MSTPANYAAMTLAGTPGTGPAGLDTALAAPNRSFFAAYGAGTKTLDVEWYSDAAATTVLGCETVTYDGASPGTLTRGTPETPSSLISLPAGASVRVVMPASMIALLDQQLDRAFVYVRNDGVATQALSVGGNTITTPLATVVNNPRSEWSAATKRFTPTRAGNYFVSGGVQFGAGGAGTMQVQIINSNGQVVAGAYGLNAVSQVGVISGVISCNGSTDYLQLGLYTDNTGLSTSTAPSNTFFTALFLGP